MTEIKCPDFSDKKGSSSSIVMNSQQWYDFFLFRILLIAKFGIFKMVSYRFMIEKFLCLHIMELNFVHFMPSTSYILHGINRLVNTKTIIYQILNLPYIFSLFFVEFFENLEKKFIFLCQISIFLTFPILCYNFNNRLLIHSGTNYAKYIINDYQEIFYFQKNRSSNQKNTLDNSKIIQTFDKVLLNEKFNINLLKNVEINQNFIKPKNLNVLDYCGLLESLLKTYHFQNKNYEGNKSLNFLQNLYIDSSDNFRNPFFVSTIWNEQSKTNRFFNDLLQDRLFPSKCEFLLQKHINLKKPNRNLNFLIQKNVNNHLITYKKKKDLNLLLQKIQKLYTYSKYFLIDKKIKNFYDDFFFSKNKPYYKNKDFNKSISLFSSNKIKIEEKICNETNFEQLFLMNLENEDIDLPYNIKFLKNLNKDNFFQNISLSEIKLSNQKKDNNLHEDYTLLLQKINKQKPLLTKNSTKIQTLFSNFYKKLKITEFDKLVSDATVATDYSQWMVTSQWWIFYKKLIIKKSFNFLTKISDYSQYLLSSTNDFLLSIVGRDYFFSDKTLSGQIPTFLISSSNKLPLFSLKKFNGFLLKETCKPKQGHLPLSNSFSFAKLVDTKEWVLFDWLLTIGIVFSCWCPILLGPAYIMLWKKFEKMQSLLEPNWNTSIEIIILNDKRDQAKKTDLVSYSSNRFLLWIKTLIYKNLISNKLMSRVLLNFQLIDILNRKSINHLILQYFVPNKSLVRRKELSLPYLNSISSLSHSYIPEKEYEKTSFSFFNRITNCLAIFTFLATESSCRPSLFSAPKKKFLRFLPEPVFGTKRWLLIGSLETGKSYFIKNFSSEQYLPLLHISYQQIKNMESTFQLDGPSLKNKYGFFKPALFLKNLQNSRNELNKIKIMKTSYLLVFIFKLCKNLTPSLLWVSNLDEFITCRSSLKKNNVSNSTEFLWFIILKIMNKDFLNNKIHFFGSTNNPSLLDPQFLSPRHLDLILNLRISSHIERQNIFSNLLNIKKLSRQKLSLFHDFNKNTMGYNLKDLYGLLNEILLINKTKKTNLVDSDIVRLALYRQISIYRHIPNIQQIEKDSLPYKIGKALIQSVLQTPASRFNQNINMRHDLWKTRFYYLSNAYLEYFDEEVTGMEFGIISQILACLAGVAANDVYFVNTNSLNTKKHINNSIRYDLYIASHLLQALYLEYPMLDITNKKNKSIDEKNYIFRKTYNKNLLKQTSYLSMFNDFHFRMFSSLKVHRMSLSWLVLFDGIRKNLPRKSYLNISPYLNNNDFFEFQCNSEYVLEYDSLDFPLFLVGNKLIENLDTLNPRYNTLFLNKDLLINRDLLTKIYITYGKRFEKQKLRPKRAMMQLLWPTISIKNFQKNISVGNENETKTFEFEVQKFFNFLQLSKTNAQLQQAQSLSPKYFSENLFIAGPQESLSKFNLFENKEYSIGNRTNSSKELLIYGMLLESYNYLIKLFLCNQNLFKHIKEKLLNRKILLSQDFDSLIN